MISVSNVYDTTLALIRKDRRGLSFSPEDYNSVLRQVNQRVWRITYHNFESSKLSMDELGSLKIVDYQIALNGSGVGALPANYFHLAGDPWYTHPTAGRRKIDLITSLEYGQRELDYLTKASALYPTCYVGYDAVSGDMALYVTPVTCTPIYISYLRQTVDPYLDYYINNTTLEVTYMATAVNVNLPAGCTAPAISGIRGETSGPAAVASQTINFDWHPHDEPQVIAQLLQAVGISLPDELILQTGTTNEIKVERE